MGNSRTRDFGETLRYIEKLGVNVDINFDGGTSMTGKILYVGSDFLELKIPVPGSDRRAVCPFWSIRYLSAEYQAPEAKNNQDEGTVTIKPLR